MGFRLKSSIFDARKMRKEASNCGNSAVMVRRRAISGKGSSPEEPIGPRMVAWRNFSPPLLPFYFPNFFASQIRNSPQSKGRNITIPSPSVRVRAERRL